MIAEFGHYLLSLAAVLALAGAFAAVWGILRARPEAAGLWRVCAPAAAVMIAASAAILVYAFLTDDFSVKYVADHSNTGLETVYKVAAFWGSHEGSMLLWIVFGAVLGAVAPWFIRSDEAAAGRTSTVMLAVTGIFSFFVLAGSNPFLRNLPDVPLEGRDLNPILQDVGMILHPPVIFAAYACLALVFAAVAAALWLGEMKPSLWRLIKKSALASWVLLTAGNALGSWWAYTELGWGGWWFWDPVENASFIPWLTCGAMLHAMILYERRGRMMKTVLALGIINFGLCLLGTFIVRSGVMQSVHAFASDPERGTMLLIACVLMMLPAAVLYGWRIDRVAGKEQGTDDPGFYDAVMTAAVFVLCTAGAAVLVGTLYPVFYDMLGLGSLTVGAPYFNGFFAPMTLFAAFVAGVSHLLACKSKKTAAVVCAVLSAAAGCAAFVTGPQDVIMTAASFAAAAWVVTTAAAALLPGSKFPKAALLAHAALAVAIMGAAGVSQYEKEALVRMGPGAGKPLGDVAFVHRETYKVNTRAYFADCAHIEVLKMPEEKHVTDLFPMRQTFVSSGMQMSAAGISHGLLRDLYVSMGNKLSDTEWLVRVSIKPLASWLWISAFLMMIAGICAALRRRKGSGK